SFYFFFQAEDGIRAPLVTGVQTCALPILSTSPGVRNLSRAGMTVAPGGTVVVLARPTLVTRFPSTMTVAASPGGRPVPSISVARSEERRVGKEGRSWVETEQRTSSKNKKI